MPRSIEINDFWAGIIGTLLVTVIIGGFSLAWNVTNAQSITQEKVESIEKANVPSRMDKLEEKVTGIKDNVEDIKSEQKVIGSKIDLLLRQKVVRDEDLSRGRNP